MNAKRILGNANQPVPHEPEKDEAKVDPEKFKKVMKIDESDQAQKRNKRNLKREEEEGDEEGAIEEPAPPSASSSFSEFMDDSDVLGNVFESDAAGIRRQAAPQNKRPFDLPSPGSIDTRGVELSNEET